MTSVDSVQLETALVCQSKRLDELAPFGRFGDIEFAELVGTHLHRRDAQSSQKSRSGRANFGPGPRRYAGSLNGIGLSAGISARNVFSVIEISA
jgi:hypothetical protein